MRFVIMADGKGTRWDNYMGIPKHLAEINGEPILGRTVRLLNEMTEGEAEVIVTSHDERYEFKGSRRHEPLDNKLEIDRFTRELIADDTCFLYGDTYYTEEALSAIINMEADDLLFFGNTKSIVAVKIKDSALFEHHVDNVKKLFLAGKIERCVGWQVYQSVTGQDFANKAVPAEKFILLAKETTDFNTPEEYREI
ncbi:MAG: 2-C-methyl-D-erythritol 4-phosphate cytidylyltransferase [Firmicutes bacterium]|nr:2-C-methyl-D-erythritol 4-phosphate cytidylyltransferase [Bacillota bacterium]